MTRAMRKLLSFGMVCLLSVFWLQGQSASAAEGGAVFSLTPSGTSLQTGAELRVTVAGDNLTDLYAYEANLTFDADRLQYKSVTAASSGYPVAPVVQGNRLRFAFTKTGSAAGTNGAAALFTVVFTAKATGSADVRLDSIKLVDTNLAAVTVSSDAAATVAIASGSGGSDPGDDPGTNPGTDPGTGPVTEPGSDPGTTPAQPPAQGLGESLELKTELQAEDGVQTAVATIPANVWSQAAAQAGASAKVRVNLSASPNAAAYVLQLPAEAVTDSAAKLEAATPFGTVSLAAGMFAAGELQSDTVGLRIAKADPGSLGDAVKSQIGDHPVLDLSFVAGGQVVPWNNPSAPVTISIDYQPTAAELLNPEHITVWYIDGQGKAQAVPNGRYDARTGKVTFSTTHFSAYAVVYVDKTFSDIGSIAWARKQIEVLAAKGIANGVSDDRFAPGQPVTRADFTVLLVRMLELNGTKGAAFTDVREGAYYEDAVRIARGMGITDGIGGNRFNPASPITRQEMIVLADKAMQAARVQQAAASAGGAFAADYKDAASIAAYAKASIASLAKAGLIQGYDDGGIHPKDLSTRAQVAVFLYNIYNYIG